MMKHCISTLKMETKIWTHIRSLVTHITHITETQKVKSVLQWSWLEIFNTWDLDIETVTLSKLFNRLEKYCKHQASDLKARVVLHHIQQYKTSVSSNKALWLPLMLQSKLNKRCICVWTQVYRVDKKCIKEGPSLTTQDRGSYKLTPAKKLGTQIT